MHRARNIHMNGWFQIVATSGANVTDANDTSQSILLLENTFQPLMYYWMCKHNCTEHKSLDFTFGHLVFEG